MSKYFWIGVSDSYMPLVAFLVFLFNRDKVSKKEWEIVVYCALSFLLFSVTNVMVIKKINNLFLYHFFCLVEVVLIGHYLVKITFKKQHVKIWLTLSAAFLIFWLINIRFNEPLNTFNMVSAGIDNLIILFFCMIYLLGLSTREEILYFQKVPSFWIVSGFLIFSALSLMVYITYGNFTDPNEANFFWTIVITVATYCKFILISVGFLCYRRSPSSQTLRL